jgi:hypothetical protein
MNSETSLQSVTGGPIHRFDQPPECGEKTIHAIHRLGMVFTPGLFAAAPQICADGAKSMG